MDRGTQLSGLEHLEWIVALTSWNHSSDQLEDGANERMLEHTYPSRPRAQRSTAYDAASCCRRRSCAGRQWHRRGAYELAVPSSRRGGNASAGCEGLRTHASRGASGAARRPTDGDALDERERGGTNGARWRVRPTVGQAVGRVSDESSMCEFSVSKRTRGGGRIAQCSAAGRSSSSNSSSSG